MAGGELGALLQHVGVQVGDQRRAQFLANGLALIDALAVDGPLDLKQGVDPAHDLHGDRGDDDLLLAGRLASRVFLQIGHGEERAPRMHPAGGFLDGAGLALRLIELGVTAKGVGLQDAAVSGQMRLRVRAAAIARVVEHRRRRIGAAERLVVAHIGPTSGDGAFTRGQDWHGGVVAVQTLGGHDVGFDAPQQRREHRAACADGVGCGGERDRHAFAGVALDLAV